MVRSFVIENNQLKLIDSIEKAIWTHFEMPDETYQQWIMQTLNIDEMQLKEILDEDEISHIDQEDNYSIIYLDVPVEGQKDATHETASLAIIKMRDMLLTVVNQPFDLPKYVDHFRLLKQVENQDDMLLTLMYGVVGSFLPKLKQIEKMSQVNDGKIKQSTTNDALLAMLDLQKSIVYFISSLNANHNTFEHLKNDKSINLNQKHLEMIDDIIIESKQANEMCLIYQEIVGTTSSVIGSIISNNLNDVMKIMTSVTILLSMPMIVTGFYGMNVEKLPFFTIEAVFIITLVIILITWYYLKKKKML